MNYYDVIFKVKFKQRRENKTHKLVQLFPGFSLFCGSRLEFSHKKSVLDLEGQSEVVGLFMFYRSLDCRTPGSVVTCQPVAQRGSYVGMEKHSTLTPAASA